MDLGINFLMLVSAAFLFMGVFGSSFQTVRYKLPQGEAELKKIKMRSFIAGIFPFTRNLLEKFGAYKKIKDRLEAAHLDVSPIEFINLKILLMMLLGGIALFAAGKPNVWWVLFALFFGYMGPEIWLNKKIAARKYEISRVLPETVDLLGLCVEAGLDFTTSVRWIIEKTPGNPMIEELKFVLEEIKWGKSRSQALKDMSRRLNISEVSSFAQTLVQAERMGTPITEAFMILSEDTRLQRFHRGERFAMKAPLKILIPLIFCILPVIGIVIGGPIFIQFMQNKIF